MYRAIATRLTKESAQHFKAQELSNTVWALATAEVIPTYVDTFDTSMLDSNVRPSPRQAEADPVTVCFALAAQELMRRPYDFKTQEIKDILWSFSKVRECLALNSVVKEGKQGFLLCGLCMLSAMGISCFGTNTQRLVCA
jgi:hypothetical protein